MTTLVKLRGPFAVAIGALLVAGAGSARFLAAGQGRGPSVAPPYIVEWVYRVKWGHKEEFFQLFKKYQVPVLEREKQLGYVNQYTIYSPSLHTSEDARWDYRIVIAYKDQASATHGGEVEKSLFPDAELRKHEENRRWELTTNHWDLPIHEVDPHVVE